MKTAIGCENILHPNLFILFGRFLNLVHKHNREISVFLITIEEEAKYRFIIFYFVGKKFHFHVNNSEFKIRNSTTYPKENYVQN